MALTQVSSVDVVTTAYNLAADYALRPELYYDRFADVKATNQSHNGATVRFIIFADLAAATSDLSETSDVTPVAMSDTYVDVTLAEKGNAVQTTAKLRGESYIVPFDPVVANIIGYNAGLSIDTICQNVLQAGTNAKFSGAAADRTHIATNSNLTAANVRRATAFLRGNNVPTVNGSYIGFIHPDIAYDFKSDTAASNWFNPHAYSAPENIFQGELGMFEGVRFIESPRAPLFADASNGSGSTGTIDVYGTLFMGRQALAKGYSNADGNGPNPQIVPGPVTDLLRRFVPLGWYHLVGYAIYRQAALLRYESASSIGANS